MSAPFGKSVALAVVALCAAFASSAEIATREAQINPPDSNAMHMEANSPVVKEVLMETQFVVCGGGLSGICAAISAARHGAKTVLVQDRPMLGGNASSEIRMGILGAHGDENKEAGILEELQLRNFYYNPLMRYTLWDDVLLSAVRENHYGDSPRETIKVARSWNCECGGGTERCNIGGVA